MSNGPPPNRNNSWTLIIVAIIGAAATVTVGHWQSKSKDESATKFIGRVTDHKTGKPLRKAKISLEGSDVPPITYTDSEGIFSFPLKDSGKQVRVRIAADSYQEFDRRINAIIKNEPEEFPLDLIQSAPQQTNPSPLPSVLNSPKLKSSSSSISSSQPLAEFQPTSFVSSSNLSILNSNFRWQNGNLSSNEYNISTDGILVISTTGHTDQSGSEDTAPLVAYKVRGNFEAEVKVKFSSNISYQRAGFGVRSPTNRYEYFRIQMLEQQRIEASTNHDRKGDVLKTLEYVQETVYFKIKRRGNELNIFYSSDRSDWRFFGSSFYPEVSQEAEIFFNVLSGHNSAKAFGEFSEFKIRTF